MLCRLKENGKEKSVAYWEKDIEVSVTDYTEHNFSVDFIEDIINEDITIRTCHVKNKTTNEEKEIKQIHYGGWPDHEIPSDMKNVYGNILFMFNFVDNLIGQGPNIKHPIVVHCSAGVGRTGTFISLYNIYRDILNQIHNKKKKSIFFSLMNTVRQLKEMRLYLVENDDQYKMIYQFISKLLNDRN
jgi:protein tyrosine phosphatase